MIFSFFRHLTYSRLHSLHNPHYYMITTCVLNISKQMHIKLCNGDLYHEMDLEIGVLAAAHYTYEYSISLVFFRWPFDSAVDSLIHPQKIKYC